METNKPLTLEEAKDKVAKECNFSFPNGSKIETWDSFKSIYGAHDSVIHKIAELYKSSHVSALQAEIESLREFKRYVHDRLDKMGIPENPEPDNNEKHGCRIEGRLNVVEALSGELKELERSHFNKTATLEFNLREKNEFIDSLNRNRKLMAAEIEALRKESDEVHNKIMARFELDFGSIHDSISMDAYTVSGFVRKALNHDNP